MILVENVRLQLIIASIHVLQAYSELCQELVAEVVMNLAKHARLLKLMDVHNVKKDMREQYLQELQELVPK